jgi:hypothetical protein
MPEKDLITVAEFAKRKGYSRTAAYALLQTVETPDAPIVPVMGEDGKFKIDWNVYKKHKKRGHTRRTVLPSGI